MGYHTLGHKTSEANFRFQSVTFALRNHFIKVLLRPSGSLLYDLNPVLTYFSKHTLRPPDLRGRTVSRQFWRWWPVRLAAVTVQLKTGPLYTRTNASLVVVDDCWINVMCRIMLRTCNHTWICFKWACVILDKFM